MNTPPKTEPERLQLRATPRRVVRFRRGLLIGAAAVASGAVLGVAIMALRGPASRLGYREELYDTGKKVTPDGLAALPSDYSVVKPRTPVLGPPLPGDLGRPILAHQRALGGGEALSAEEQRLAQQALHAREAGVFFRIQNRPIAGVAASGNGAPQQMAAAPSQPESNRLALDPERDQNNQQRKLDFLRQRDTSGVYNPHALQTPASPYQIMAGSVIAASLITGINSDLPGLVVAQVTENVYDTVSGRTLLVPQGSRLVGTYDSVVAFGQSRALLIWRRIVLPDGSSVEIDNLPATDTAGYAGLEDEVDHHTWTLLKGVVLSTLLGVGTQLSIGSGQSDLLRAIRESTQQNAATAGRRITDKNLNIQPTITVRPGFPLRVIVHKDIILEPYRGG
ncbi:MAG: conjugal transfer protein TrbI [Methylocystaceae bacterium]|nr:MAG: conjugal transfer protein TrbI [Methylocystaceae bacterium]